MCSHFDTIPACGRQTDRQTDRRTKLSCVYFILHLHSFIVPSSKFLDVSLQCLQSKLLQPMYCIVNFLNVESELPPLQSADVGECPPTSPAFPPPLGSCLRTNPKSAVSATVGAVRSSRCVVLCTTSLYYNCRPSPHDVTSGMRRPTIATRSGSTADQPRRLTA